MKHYIRWTVLLLAVVSLILVACSSALEADATTVAASRLEPIEGTDLNRVILTEKAAERLGIEVGVVSEEEMSRERTLSGKIEALPTSPDDLSVVRVRVPLSVKDMTQVAVGEPARVVLLDDSDDALEVDTLDPDEDPVADAVEDALEAQSVQYYELDNTKQGFAPGSLVRVVVPLMGSGVRRLVVPYAALLYDINGGTWIYVNPEPLTYQRVPVTVEYITGDQAVLTDGPPVGTSVVTVGVSELYGADTGVGK